MRDQIAHIVTWLEPYDILEIDHIHVALNWIESGAPIFRTQKPATPPQHLVSYFVLVDLAQQKVLLVDHKEADLWLPSGGHVELDEHPRKTVEREALEELAIKARFVWPDPIFLTVTKTQGASADHTDVSLWYVLHGDCTEELSYDHGEFYTVAWFSFDELPLHRADPHLQRFMIKLQRILNNALGA